VVQVRHDPKGAYRKCPLLIYTYIFIHTHIYNMAGKLKVGKEGSDLKEREERGSEGIVGRHGLDRKTSKKGKNEKTRI
jgi:hypothetical protein